MWGNTAPRRTESQLRRRWPRRWSVCRRPFGLAKPSSSNYTLSRVRTARTFDATARPMMCSAVSMPGSSRFDPARWRPSFRSAGRTAGGASSSRRLPLRSQAVRPRHSVSRLKASGSPTPARSHRPGWPSHASSSPKPEQQWRPTGLSAGTTSYVMGGATQVRSGSGTSVSCTPRGSTRSWTRLARSSFSQRSRSTRTSSRLAPGHYCPASVQQTRSSLASVLTDWKNTNGVLPGSSSSSLSHWSQQRSPRRVECSPTSAAKPSDGS